MIRIYVVRAHNLPSPNQQVAGAGVLSSKRVQGPGVRGWGRPFTEKDRPQAKEVSSAGCFKDGQGSLLDYDAALEVVFFSFLLWQNFHLSAEMNLSLLGVSLKTCQSMGVRENAGATIAVLEAS